MSGEFFDPQNFNFLKREDSIEIPTKKWTAKPPDSQCGIPYFEAKSFVSDDFQNEFEPSLFSLSHKRARNQIDAPSAPYVERETMSASNLSSVNSSTRREAKYYDKFL